MKVQALRSQPLLALGSFVLVVGVLALLVVVLPRPAQPEPAWQNSNTVAWRSISPDASILQVDVKGGVYPDGSPITEQRVLVSQNATTVRLIGQCRDLWPGLNIGGGKTYTVEVRLGSPLNGRQVLNEWGDPIPEKPAP